MGSAQIISLSEVRASNQWQRLRDDLHTRFDQWLDRLQEQLPNPQTRLAEVTEAVWQLRARPGVARTVETMVGPVHVERPYFYCPSGCGGVYPLDQVLDLAPGRKQLDVQQAAAQVAIEMPYEEAHTLFSDLTGVQLGSERLHTFVHQAAEELSVLDVAPSRQEIAQRIEEMAAGCFRRPVLVLGIDGA